MRIGSKAACVALFLVSGGVGCGGEPTPHVPGPSSTTSALASLPPNAAAYGSFRGGQVTKALADLRARADVFEDLAKTSDQQLAPLLLAGLDGERSVLAAAVPASEKQIRSIVAAAAAGASLEATQKLAAENAGQMSRVRLIVPVVKGRDRMALANLVAKQLAGLALETCPASPSCQGIGGGPLGVAMPGGGAVVAYPAGDDLQIDFGFALVSTERTAAAMKAMEDFRTQRGGPRGDRCAKLDTSKSVSFCFDAAPLADLASTRSSGFLLGLMTHEGLTPNDRKRIAKDGNDDAENVQAMMQAPTSASDGTFTIDASSSKPVTTGSWLLDTKARATVGKAFSTPRCATGNAIATELAPALSSSVGGQEPAATVKQGLRTGFGGIGVAVAGQWVQMIDGVLTLAPDAKTSVPPKLRACVAVVGDRLTVTVDEAP